MAELKNGRIGGPRARSNALRALIAGVLVLGLASVTALVQPAPVSGAAVGAPLTCAAPTTFLADTGVGADTQLYALAYGTTSVTETPVGPAWTGGIYNALGFDPVNDYLYALSSTDSHLLQIDQSGNVTDLGAVTGGVPGPPAEAADGAFDSSGNYWVEGGGNISYAYEINITTRAVVKSLPLTTGFAPNDFTFDGGYLWGAVGGAAQGSTEIYRLDPSTGQVSVFNGPATGDAEGDYNADWTFADGDLGFAADDTGYVYDVSVTNPASAAPTFALVSTYTATWGSNGTADGTECQTPVKPTVTTTVNDASTSASWTGGEVTGATAEDTSSVTGAANGAPTGTVSYSLFGNGACTGAATPEGAGLPLGSDSLTTAALAAGTYGFEASYSGDANYLPLTGGCESFTVNPATPSVATVVDDGAGTAWSGSEVTGATAYDTSSVSGVAGFTPTGTVSYSLFANGTCAGSGTPEGTGLPLSTGSSTTAGLTAGTYGFVATYSGDGNYAGVTGTCEAFTVNAAPPSVTTVVDDGNGTPWSGTDATGATAEDTATVAGVPGVTATGTVTYTLLSGGCSGSAVWSQTVGLNADGTVPNSPATSALGAGAYAFQASYSGDANYAGPTASGCEPFSVGMASAAVGTNVVEAGSTTGATAYDTSTVAGVAGFTPTGTVTYTLYRGTCSTPVSSQTVGLNADGTVPASPATGALGAGAYSFQASYSGDGNYAGGSTSPCEPFTVGQATPLVGTAVYDGTGATWSGNEITGATAYDTSSVTGVPGFTPGGTVSYALFANGTCTGAGTPEGAGLPLGTNSSTTAALAAGTYGFEATYSGDSNYAGLTGGCEPFTVAPATPGVGTAVDDSALPAVAPAWSGNEITGATAYDTSSVTGVAGFTPGGTVSYTLFANGTCTGAGTPEGAGLPLGTNSSTTAALAAGTYGFEATYSGDSNYAGLTGGCEPFTVAPATPSVGTAVDDPALPAVAPAWSGSEVTGATAYDTSAVTGVAGFTPAGTVSYSLFANGTCTGAATPEGAGLAVGTNSSTTAALAAGTYGFEATYSGDSNYAGLTGSCESFIVTPATPQVGTTVYDGTNTAWNGTEGNGSKAYDTATVAGAPGFTPTGTVTYGFFKNGTCTGTASTTQTVTLSGGTVPNSSTTAALAVGNYGFEASYASTSPNYASSAGGCEPFTVTAIASTVGTVVHDLKIGLPWNWAEVTGSAAYDSATVTKVSGLTPTGTLTYSLFANGTCTGTASTTQTVPLIAGLVPNSIPTAPLAAGSYGFLAVYSGDANYKKATGACENFTVGKAPTLVGTLVNDAKTGKPWNWAEVTGATAYDTSGVLAIPGFKPTGTVTYSFYKNGSCTGTAATTQTVTLSNGLVPNSAATAGLAPGSYCFRATYSGDSNYQPSIGCPESFTVAKAPAPVGTVVYAAKTNKPWTGTQAAGATAYDTATVTGVSVSGFTPTGTVTYTLHKGGCSGPVVSTQTVTLANGKVPNSATTAALGAGSYSYQVTYSGDPDYSGSTGCCETFSVAGGGQGS